VAKVAFGAASLHRRGFALHGSGRVRYKEADFAPVDGRRFVIILPASSLCCSNIIEHWFLVIVQRSIPKHSYSSLACLYNININHRKQVRSDFILRNVRWYRVSGWSFPKIPHGNHDTPSQSKISTPAPGSWELHVTPEAAQPSFVDTMSHAVDHALRNAPSDKPHPPWLQQLQAQWKATKHALGRTHGTSTRPASIDESSLGHGRPLRRKSSLHSLKEALLQTKDALLTAIGMLPRKPAEAIDDSWL
jgi:hypothetical protein